MKQLANKMPNQAKITHECAKDKMTYRNSSCLSLEIENGMSPNNELVEKSLKQEKGF